MIDLHSVKRHLVPAILMLGVFLAGAAPATAAAPLSWSGRSCDRSVRLDHPGAHMRVMNAIRVESAALMNLLHSRPE